MSIETPINEEEFIRHCKTRLSFLKINVTPDQEKITLQKAKKKFLEFHRDSTETVFIRQEIKQEDLDNGYFLVPPEVWEVNNLLSYRQARSFSNQMIYDLEMRYAMHNNMSSISANAFDGRESAIVSYWLYRMDASLYQSHFNRDDEFRWSKVTRKLVVDGGPRFEVGNYIIYEATRSLEDQPGFWSIEWFAAYYSALLKKVWGENLTKFNSVELPGGITLNGQGIKEEAVTEIKELEDEVFDVYSDFTRIYVS